MKWQIRDEQASTEYAQDEGYKCGREDGIAEGEAKGKTEIAKKYAKREYQYRTH